jgi:hypothetical protein
VKLSVLVVGLCGGTRELLERRVGGILGEMAWVRSAAPDDVRLREPAPDLIVTMARSQLADGVRQRADVGRTGVVAVELTLLPAAVVTLSRLPADRPVGVVCHHRGCANAFLAEIIRSGVVGHRFASGGFGEMAAMDVGCFVCPEDVARDARAGAGGRPVVPVPRGVSPYSAAELIQTVLTLRKGRQNAQGARGQSGAAGEQERASGRRI